MKRWLIPGSLFTLFLSLGLVFGPGILAERRIRSKLSILAGDQFDKLSRSDRSAIVKRERDHMQTLEQEGWDYLITTTTATESRYQLNIGDTRLMGCLISGEGDQTSAVSQSFSHAVAGATRKTKKLALTIPSLAQKEAVLIDPAMMPLGADGVDVFGSIRVDSEGVHVHDAFFQMQDRLDEQLLERFQVAPFSLDTSPEILSNGDWSYEWTLPAPEFLDPMFGDAKPFIFLQIKARLGVDLTQENPGYFLEGSIITLNKPRGDLRVTYYPGDRFTFSLESYLLPLLPSVCIHINQVELTFDIPEHRLVMFGQANLIDTKSLNCALPDADLLPDFLVNGILDKARDQFQVPESLVVTTGFMLDFDDGFAVGKLSLQNHGLFHAGYFPNGKLGELRMWVPTTYNSSEGTWNVLKRIWDQGSDSLTFPETDPYQLYPLDPAEEVEKKQ